MAAEVWANTVKRGGADRQRIFQGIKEPRETPASYQARAQACNPDGAGKAAARIVPIEAPM